MNNYSPLFPTFNFRAQNYNTYNKKKYCYNKNYYNNIDNDINSGPQEQNTCNPPKNKPIIEFLGIKIYQDDLLILLLIYFLYKENIKDNLLLFALFSLLF